MIKETLNRLKDVRADFCVTILLPTHRTHPENKQDAILLKKLIHEASERLASTFEKRAFLQTMHGLETIQKELDHNYNLDGLAIFVNENTALVERLPFPVEARVVIDQTFATRDLVRALNQMENYYILTLSEKAAHLFGAFDDRITQEFIAEGFPIQNTWYTTNTEKLAHANTHEIYLKEYFNQVDKSLQRILTLQPAQVVVVTVEKNYAYFREVSDHPERLIGYVNRSWDRANLFELAAECWKVVEANNEAQRRQAIGQVETAESQGKLVSSLTDIWAMVQEGRGDALYVEKDFFQPAEILNGNIALREDPRAPGITDDIVDEIIEQQLRMRGQVVFLENGQLEPYGRIALSLRY